TYTVNMTNSSCSGGTTSVIASDNFNTSNDLSGWTQWEYSNSNKFNETTNPGQLTFPANCFSPHQLITNNNSYTTDGVISVDYYQAGNNFPGGIVFRAQPGLPNAAYYYLQITQGSGCPAGSISLRYVNSAGTDVIVATSAAFTN